MQQILLASHSVGGLRLYRAVALLAIFMAGLLNAGEVTADNCVSAFHCSDGGKRFRAIAEYMVQEMRVNSAEARQNAALPLDHKTSWWYHSVKSGARWDHKSTIETRFGSRYADIPGQDSDLFYDAWSNIHYGYVGSHAAFPTAMLEWGADAADWEEHKRFFESDRKWVGLGLSMADRIPPNQLTADILVQEMLALMPEVAALPCDDKEKSVRPIVKNSITNPLFASPQPRIMIVGDSITHGKTGDYTWRYRLHEHLRATAHGFDFVGPFKYPLEPNKDNDGRRPGTYRINGWDDDHNATWGRPLGFEQATIGDYVRTYQPELIIVHLGTNDLTWFHDKDLNIDGNALRVANHMREFINNARQAKPDVDFLIAKIGATKWLEDLGQPSSYNRLLGNVAEEMRTENSCIGVADVQSAWSWPRDTYDQTHPNAHGEYVIAKAVADELHNRWGYGAAFGTIPISPTGPFDIKPKGLKVYPAVAKLGDSVTIEWDRVANNVWTEYRVEVRTHQDWGFAPVWRAENTTRETRFEYTHGFPHAGVYHIVVWAEDINGWKAMSDPIAVSVGDYPPPPPKVPNIVLTPNVIGQDGGFIAKWDRVNVGVAWTEYKVRVHTHSAYGFIPIWEQPGTTPFETYTYDGPRFPMTGVYHVVVVARDHHGQETWSDPVPLTVQEQLPPPLPPQNLRLDRTSVWRSDKFTLEWDRVPNPKVWTTYKMRVRYHRAFGYGLIWESPEATKDTKLTYTGPVLPQDGTYHVTVVAIDHLTPAQMTESEPVELRATTPPPPPVPTNIRFEPAQPTLNTPLLYMWDRVQQPGVWTQYKVELHYHVNWGFGYLWESAQSTPHTSLFDWGPHFTQPGVYSGVVIAEDIFGQRTASPPFDIPVTEP